MTGTPEITDSTRPVTQRSALKDPDSPTSVLDFSQAGNLFVVNPDTSGIKAVSDSSILVKQPLATRSTPTPRVLSATSDTIPTPSTTSSSLDRPTSLTLSEQVTPRLPEGEAEDERPVEDKVMDFDMSRSANASQPNPVKKDHERSKSRMGLRRTLAKLSIAIPTHGPVSSPGLAKTSHRSPCAQSTTPHSAKSLGMASNDDVESPDSGSSGGPLSRQSSGSSFGSPKNALDSRSRRSSAGSTRIMTVSPGPSSPNVGYLRMTSIPGSGPGSAVPSAANSATPSATPSRASSPTMLSDSSASVGAQDDQSNRERHHGVSRLSTTPTKPDIRLHVGTPVTEEMRHKGYYQPDDSDSRPSTPSPLANMESTTHSSPTTPNSFIQPWAVGRKYSNASVASSSLDPLERGQTAQGIRDEFYLNKDVQDQNMPTESFETRMVELQTGIPTSSGSAQCSVIKPFYEEPVVAGRFAGQMTQGSEQAVCNAVNQHKVQEYSMAPPAMETHPPHTVSTPPPAALLSPSASGILMAPRQSPESFYDGDEYPLPFQSAGFSPAQWFHESRSSSSHSFHSHPGVEANTPSQAPFEARARSISPHVKTSISRSTSQGSAVALTDSNLELPAQEFSPQNLEGARIQGAMSMKPTVEQFPSEIYSTSGSVPDNSRRHGTPHPMIPLLSSNSFPSDQRWLTLNDADVSNQLGAQGSGTLIEQPLDMHSTNAEVYGDAPGYHESDYYPGCASAPSSEHTSSHPSRSNSRRSSPKRHWHSDPTTPIVQQPMMAQESGHYDVTANGKHCQQNRTMTMTTDIPQRQVQSKVYPTDAGAYPSREAMQSVHKRDARQQALSQQNSHGRGVMNGGSALETMSKGEHEEEIGEPGSTRGNRAVLSVVNLEHDQNQGEAQ
ncbi:hypothetical protein BG011_009276 [Mortierella polycephala]|uniref:Uncharacterized protein n=1 Tax=Mortierella polycephala TaxID=41804 RepID=A0A9P6PPM5_9FUNG|nr:hypothetical protein BG011_009276 [Mortierella polycephala]